MERYADTYVPGPPYCAYGLRVPPPCVLYVPEAQGSLVRGRHYCTYRVPPRWSFTLADGMAGDELLNQWEVRVKHNESFNGGKGWFSVQDDVETKLYGLRPFESHGSPRSDGEAAERSMCAARTSSTHAPRAHHAALIAPYTLIYMRPCHMCATAPRGRYALLNLAGADGGSPLYGDISAVRPQQQPQP